MIADTAQEERFLRLRGAGAAAGIHARNIAPREMLRGVKRKDVP